MTDPMSKSETPPRKVVIGTLMKSFWDTYPGLDKRLGDLCSFIDQMAQRSRKCGYDDKLDLVVLPENAVCDENAKTAVERCIPFSGPVQDAMSAKAREHNTYLIVPLFLDENGAYSNAAVLLNHAGYHYSEREDTGLFWSNDPNLPIGQMVREHDLEQEADLLTRNKALRNAV